MNVLNSQLACILTLFPIQSLAVRLWRSSEEVFHFEHISFLVEAPYTVGEGGSGQFVSDIVDGQSNRNRRGNA